MNDPAHRALGTDARTRRYERTGIVLTLFAAAAFSAKSVFIKLAYRYGVDAVTLLSLRMLFSLPFFVAMAVAYSRRTGGLGLEPYDWAALAGLGVMGYYMSSLLDFLGLQYISAGLERLILFSYPTIVIVLSALWFRRVVTRREIFALVVTYLGIAVAYAQDISVQQKSVTLGSLLVFGSAVVYSMYLIASAPLIRRLGSVRFSALAFIAATIATLSQYGATHGVAGLVQPWPVYGWALVTALLSTVVPIIALNEGIRRVGSGRAAMVGSIGPVVTIALASSFLGEPLGVPQVVGAALVLLGVVSISVARR